MAKVYADDQVGCERYLGWDEDVGRVGSRLVEEFDWVGALCRGTSFSASFFFSRSVTLKQLGQAKDCLQLLHLWLTKRELETRRVKNRDFSGVDVNELDLIPTWGRD